MPRPPSIQWYYKQWLGDNRVLAMDWDARAMHFHLLMMSIQEEPSGSIPNDMALIRRWLWLPSGQSESDRTWARVQPQIFSAWSLEDERWFNSGMVETIARKERYALRYEIGTKPVRKNAETRSRCNSFFSSEEKKEKDLKAFSSEEPTPKDQPPSSLALGLAEKLQLQINPGLLFDIASAIRCAAERKATDFAGAFDYLFGMATRARENGKSINRFWFQHQDDWEPKPPKPPKPRKRDPPPPDGVALKRAQLQAARERGEID